VGRPNVGKSTFLNAALGEAIAIVSSTPQTTRHRILGVVHRPGAEIALLDTPGLHKPHSRLGRALNRAARGATEEADVILYMTTPPPSSSPAARVAGRGIHPGDRTLLADIGRERPTILVVNQVDRVKDKSSLLPFMEEISKLRDFAAIIPISALREDGVDRVLDEVAKLLPVADGDRLLEQLGLAEKRDAWFMTLSGGQKQRLFIALALVNEPELVFLDELTTGLDPQARRAIWDLIRAIRARGKTVLLTTHLMEEAERLCDRVAIIEHGRIIDMDTPERLVARHCPERTVILATADPRAEDQFRLIPRVTSVSRQESRVTVSGTGADFVSAVIQCLAESGITVTDFRTVHPTLEDVFLRLTGHAIRD
jgi:hypothetical protein